jgi:hypothetical protein
MDWSRISSLVASISRSIASMSRLLVSPLFFGGPILINLLLAHLVFFLMSPISLWRASSLTPRSTKPCGRRSSCALSTFRASQRVHSEPGHRSLVGHDHGWCMNRRSYYSRGKDQISPFQGVRGKLALPHLKVQLSSCSLMTSAVWLEVITIDNYGHHSK